MQSAHRKVLLGVAVLAAIHAAVPRIAAAQTEIEEVVVTARQRAESIQDVPASITALTAETLELAGVTRAQDFVSLTPGVVMINTVEAGDTAMNIRGINQARDGESNFAFIIDGILLTNPTSFNREFDDLQQIEVVKGPQSAIYGRSAESGAVIVSTVKPDNEFDAGVKGRIGNDSSYYASGYVSGALVQDQLYGRINVNYRTTDGQYHNTFLDSDTVDDFENYNVNGRVIWEPSNQLSVDAKFRYGEITDAGAITFNQSFGFFEDVNDHDFFYKQNIDPVNEQESKEFSIKADYDMDFATLTAWFLWSDVDNFLYADGSSAGSYTFATEPNCIASTANAFASGVTLPPPSFLGPTPFTSFLLTPYGPTTCDGFQMQYRNQDDKSFEIRLTSPDDQQLRWQFGFYYLTMDRLYSLNQGVDIGEDKVIRDSFVPGRTETLISSDFDTEVLAGFGSIFYDITPEVEFAFSLRWDQEKRAVSNLVPPPSVAVTQYVDYVLPPDGIPGGAPLNPAYGFQAGQITDTVPDRSKTFDQFQPKVSLNWKATDNFSLFGSWGVGFKSGGFNATGIAQIVDLYINQLIGSTALDAPEIFDKEVTSAFEVGFKSTFVDGRLRVNGAFFHTDIDDMQFFNLVVGPFGVLRTVTNIDKVSIDGGELSVDASLTDAISLYGGVSVVNGEIDKNSGRPYTEGNEVPYAPKWTANVGMQVVTPSFLEGVNLVGRVDTSLVGPTWMHEVQDQAVPTIFGFSQDYSNTKRDAYTLLDIRAGFESPTWSVIGYARNLLNDHWLAEVIPNPELGGSYIAPGTERSWGVELSYRWQ